MRILKKNDKFKCQIVDLETTLEQLGATDLPLEIIQETGEDLGMILGQVLEARINVKTLKNRLEY
ncbi:hypothetical protein [Chroococcus sp. FPU101]|uniref:hypothetical protein n=1 Tax=Chroococcus sp. FPU101 TaxID=1974212 RepID=UPI001A8E6C0C|nr:hypothetical protein [Chroococcus sp. FPU101]GFE72012.1 hypothetical protein CFPU101_46220 [Chroococcus sp. FPU101]